MARKRRKLVEIYKDFFERKEREMEKAKRTAKKLLCLSIILMLLSMIVVSVVQTDGGKVTIKQLSIETDAGWMMDCDLYVPDTATVENPAPAIVCSHGNYNNKEMQDANFVELARRGYVVLTIDQPNHGNSDSLEGSDFQTIFCGQYQGALIMSRLPYVDKTRIGITGHSAGGRSSNFAMNEDNQNETPIISAVLLNCADATYVDGDGNFSNAAYGSRDVGIISAQYDEFFHYVYADGVAKPIHFAPYFMNTANAQSFLYFGEDPSGLEAREADTLYHQEIDGEDAVRVIYRPDIIHPWSHFSAKSTAATIEFFEEVFGAPNPIASSNQVWQWKEAFNGIGLVGMALFIVSFTILMVYTPYFSELRAAEPVAPAVVTDKKGKVWFWLSLLAGAVFSSLVFFPLVVWGDSKQTLVLQPESFGLACWSMACGLFSILSMFVYYKFYGKKNGFDLVARGVKMPWKKFGKTVLLAVIVAVLTYSWVFFADYFFKSDFRFWTLAAKAFEADKVGVAAFPYLPMFLLFYVPASVAANSFNYNNIGGKKSFFNTLIVALFVAAPALVIPWIQYAYYFATDIMLFWGPVNRLQMYTLWLFPIVIILMAATFISRAIYKKTCNPYLAGITNGIIVTIITCVNTRMYFM